MLKKVQTNKIMKILIEYRPNARLDNFEGARLRKTIKGALEMNNIPYTTNRVDDYDVVLFISPNEESKLHNAIENGKKSIAFALYTEDDPVCSYTEYRSKDGKRELNLKAKSLRFLNKVDLVLVPSIEAQQFLVRSGVITPTKVIEAGVNISRFDFSRDDEKEIFYRYFREENGKKLVLAIGEYTNNMDGISAVTNAAKRNPDTLFYFVGKEEHAKITHKTKKVIKSAPSNLKFKGVLPDDVYRSALLNSDIFMVAGYKISGTISLIEAKAAKSQIIARKQAVYSDVVNESNAYIAQYSETLTSLVEEYLNNKIKPTTEVAYVEAQENNLTKFGKKLIEIYKLI